MSCKKPSKEISKISTEKTNSKFDLKIFLLSSKTKSKKNDTQKILDFRGENLGAKFVTFQLVIRVFFNSQIYNSF